jgi:hypothetical protein
MKKRVLFVILFIALLFVIPQTFSQTDEKQLINSAYKCLNNKIEGKCSSLSLEDKLFSYLAIDECEKEILSAKKSDVNGNCWSSTPSSSCDLRTTAQVALVLAKKDNAIYLGNLKAKRDWGFAPEYVEVTWKILQYDHPEDFVIGTGEPHSVEEFIKEAFSYVGLDWQKYVEVDTKYFRPTEVDILQGDSSKARRVLNWQPKVTFKRLAKMMTDADMEIAEHEKIIKEHRKAK